MTIISEDGKVIVSVGGSMILYSLYLTAKLKIKMSRFKVGVALDFLKTGECKAKKVEKALDQLGIIKAELGKVNPENAVFDWRNPNKEAPWENNISRTVTSCADLFTTENGEILLDELINLLVYATENGISVVLP